MNFKELVETDENANDYHSRMNNIHTHANHMHLKAWRNNMDGKGDLHRKAATAHENASIAHAVALNDPLKVQSAHKASAVAWTSSENSVS